MRYRGALFGVFAELSSQHVDLAEGVKQRLLVCLSISAIVWISGYIVEFVSEHVTTMCSVVHAAH